MIDNCMQSILVKRCEAIRIHVDTSQLVSDTFNSNLTLHFINNVIRPVVKYLEKTIKVRRRSSGVRKDDICEPASECKRFELGSFCEGVKPRHDFPDTAADLVIVFTCKEESSSGTLGSSLACAFDVCDRPIYGRINISPVTVIASDTLNLKQMRAVVLHEMTHILVFDIAYFPLFRFSDGTPRVKREADGLPSKINYDVKYSAHGYMILNFANAKPQPHSIVSTTGVLDHFNERGVSCDCPGKSAQSWQRCLFNTTHGPCLGKIVTERVIEKTRAYFNCSTLNGAELENQEPEPFYLFSSHWSSRSFKGDVMTSLVGESDKAVAALSNVTLALYEDSGWYKVDYSKSVKPKEGVDEGYLAGCGFFTDEIKSLFSQTAEDATLFRVLLRIIRRLF